MIRCRPSIVAPVLACLAALLPAGTALAQTAPGPGGESPATACYRAARTHDTDAYACDLAVQMAKSPESAAAPGESRTALAAALTNRGLVLARDDRLEPALADFDAALALFPDDPALHGNRGNLLLRMGRLADALNAHDRAVELAPNDPVGYFNRAFSYLALGDRAAAQRDVEAARGLLEGARPGVGPGVSPPPVAAGGAAPDR